MEPRPVILLDTNYLIQALVEGSAEAEKVFLWSQHEGGDLVTSSVAWYEFLCGPVEDRELELALHIVQDPVPFVAEDARGAARLFNLGGRRRGSLVDCMIAAVALRLAACLATANPGDFRRLEPAGLKVVSA